MITTEISAEARAIADLLAECPPGAVVTFGAMSAVIGRDILARRHVIATARRVAEREAGAVFTVERRTGYKRLDAARIADVVGTAARAHIRRTARRSVKSLSEGTRRLNDLPPDVQRKVAAEMSALGLIEHIARDKAVKPTADAPTKPQPVAVTARAFLDALGAAA
jgi:alkylated DNA nucleotide flippase Atl1